MISRNPTYELLYLRLKQNEEGVKRRYVQLLLEDHDSNDDYWPIGAEPIYRNGEFVGE